VRGEFLELRSQQAGEFRGGTAGVGVEQALFQLKEGAG
jgi:hypothetical protein